MAINEFELYLYLNGSDLGQHPKMVYLRNSAGKPIRKRYLTHFDLALFYANNRITMTRSIKYETKLDMEYGTKESLVRYTPRIMGNLWTPEDALEMGVKLFFDYFWKVLPSFTSLSS